MTTKKQAKILDRVYPRNLHRILQGLWDSKPFFHGRPNVELPTKAVFDEIIDVCYHASMLTEEGRPTVFRIVFLDSQSAVSPRDDDELPPVGRYLLKGPVPFTPGELRRLAPVADPRRVLIAVEQSGGRLQIYGLLDVGMALWEMARHERVMGTSSPDALVVTSTRPGELSISRGDRSVIRMRDGGIVSAAQSVLLKGPVAEFFDAASWLFIHNACQLSGIDQDPAEDDGLSFAHQSFIEMVLLYTAELKHGGTLLFMPEEITHEDSRLLSRASIKYVLPSTRPQDALMSAMAARLKRNALAEKLQNRRTVNAEELEQLDALAWDQQNCEDVARDAARFIASLTAVDGAVVLTDTLRIIGFGAEVTASFSGADKVYVAHTAEATDTKEVRFAEYGTRHRSTFRFVASMEPSVGFIMSQDGGVKAVRQVGSKLVMWPYFQIGFTTALS
ncbi:putative sensor domain DACNV-containing protein [Ramlibacter sp. WS9]|uniref:putative sensor domain DACNV-containing protein n=1 Tax=Ramlibacter sp. WS9 TaxID=1882741 RepID=UPI001141D69A|nr:hypothetical protein [Ramlibacter sp. WS9]ROZ78782.1 hypothetical protein EEB15_03580 [Ramlibacter sp. WS9]